jgi:cobalamin biosynthetic protein CobC
MAVRIINNCERSAMDILMPPEHGADLASASRRYNIPLSDWLDLSTGINPRAYPIGVIDPTLFHHLPYDDGELRNAAKNYCAAPVLPVIAGGSQILIQWLPFVVQQLFKPLTPARCRVAVPSIGYSEHAFRWRWAGHEIIYYDPRVPEQIDALLRNKSIDVLIVINAHNPLGTITAPAQLLAWHTVLVERGGWLIVDEAFIDPTPQYSVVAHTQLPGLIVLRSLGKFFGLAGVRCGFAFCHEQIADALTIAVGPWAVAGPTLKIATTALRDTAWQTNTRAELQIISDANADLLQKTVWTANATLMRHALFRNKLFYSVALTPALAIDIEDRLAQRGIRVRRIEVDNEMSLLRFGLVDPNSESWLRVADAYANVGLSVRACSDR